MLKKAAHGVTLSFALSVVLAPVSRMHAQIPPQPMPGDVVTGTDPEPTGEPSSNALPSSMGTSAVAATASFLPR